jgi:Fe-S-cluster containining protein
VPLEFCLNRQRAFSFVCRACSRCCTGKIIMAGPHEVLGMSRLLGISTTEFLALYSDNGGTTLRSEADGRCVFVTASGCRVHSRRPLVCRLYPLGRMTDETGVEQFAVYPQQSDCEAEVGHEGTIETFIESQGVGPYLEWSRRYGALYGRMAGFLNRLVAEGKVGDVGPEGTTPADSGSARLEQEPDRAPLSLWQDIDASLAEYCAAQGWAVLEEIDDAIALHLRAIREWLDDLESRIGEVRNDPEGIQEK